MKPLLTTTLIAALFIGCGKQDEAPPENKSGSKPANAAGGQAVSKLVEAAFNGDLKATQALIAEGADLNQKDPNGSTPLIIAALFGHKSV